MVMNELVDPLLDLKTKCKAMDDFSTKRRLEESLVLADIDSFNEAMEQARKVNGAAGARQARLYELYHAAKISRQKAQAVNKSTGSKISKADLPLLCLNSFGNQDTVIENSNLLYPGK